MARVAQGSGSAEWMVVGVLVAVHCCSLLASSATLTVGGAQGWTIGANYASWAASQTFAVGDSLLFPYTKGAHNVVEVNKTGYDACSAASAIATYTDGNTSVPLTSAGSRYFLCSFPSHCTLGMHLTVTVGAGATPAPTPSTTVGTPPPTPATPTAPAPASATTPSTSPPTPTSTAPVPSPVSAGTPVPASTPTPTPASTASPASAPTPLSPSPASAPTPEGPPTPASTSPPPSPGAPGSTTGAPPPSSAPYRSSSASLTAAILGLGGALLAL